MEFKISHYIFASGAVPPTIDGEIKVKVTRTPIYVFTHDSENWEENETVKESELPEFLHKAFPKFSWEKCDPKDEKEIRGRFNALMMHDELRREVDDRGENLEEVETVVTLLPGSSFQYNYSYPTEEGYSSHSYEAYWNGENGWNVEVHNGGRDCDGSIDTVTEYSEDVNGNPLSKHKTMVHDETAQSMGY